MNVAEREHDGRQQILRGFDAICPGIVGNPYVPHWPTPPQMLFLGLHLLEPDADGVFEALYGGAAGGGKSNCLLTALAQYVQVPGFAGLGIRKTYKDLALPGAIMARSHEWWRGTDAHWTGDTKTWTFPSGATVTFGYLQHEHDHLQYQGSEFDCAVFDELTHLRMHQYEYIALSRIRSRVNVPVPPRALSGSNPGGPSHDDVCNRFVGRPWDNVPPAIPNRYVPARIRDNPYIDQETYIAGLMHLHPTVREQLLNGDWRARDPGDYFRAEWFGPLLDPETDVWPMSDCIRVRWWDLAASEKATAAKTAGVRMARHRSGVRAIEHCRAFRATPGKRDDLIVQTAQADGPSVVVGLEIEPGSGGIAQFEALKVRLESQGFRVAGARPKQPHQSDREERLIVRNTTSMSAKQGRADPVASCLERGYQRRGEGPRTEAPWWGVDSDRPVRAQGDGLRLFSGPWTSDYLSIVEGFPDAATCDEVDATSGAYAWLEAHPFGLRDAGAIPREAAETGDDTHPDDRPDPDERSWRQVR